MVNEYIIIKGTSLARLIFAVKSAIISLEKYSTVNMLHTCIITNALKNSVYSIEKDLSKESPELQIVDIPKGNSIATIHLNPNKKYRTYIIMED